MQEFNYIISLVWCAERIKKLNIAEIESNFSTIEEAINNLKSMFLPFSIQMLLMTWIYFMDYIKMFFLIDVLKFERIKLIIGANKDSLKDIKLLKRIMEAPVFTMVEEIFLEQIRKR